MWWTGLGGGPGLVQEKRGQGWGKATGLRGTKNRVRR